MLQVDDLDVYYSDMQALRDVSLRLEKNECVAVIGSNGAGKTTLIRTIVGLLSPKRGRIIFKDENITGLPSYEIANLGIAVTHEGRHLFPAMTVEENLRIGAYVRRAKKNMLENLKLVYEMFPVLRERSSQRAGKLSGGEQQMLAIARSLMLDPELLIMDEASLGLAPILVEKLSGVFRELKTMKLTILLVEQNVPVALSVADRGYVLENGSIMLEGKGTELLNSEEVKKRYLGI